MRILVLAAQYPETLANGYGCRLVRLLQGYHRHGHRVDLMTFFHTSSDGNVKRGLAEPWCDNIFLFRKTVVQSWRKFQRWLTIANPMDSSSLGCSSKAFEEKLREIMTAVAPDVVQFDGYAMLHYRKHVKSVPCVAFPVDCYTLALERERRIGNPFHAVRLAIHRFKVRRVERTYNSFYASIFVAKPDADRAKAISPHAKCVYVPNGVDTDYFSQTGTAGETKTIAFHGSMNFPPNVEAAIWFIKQVWPRIKVNHPESRFLVIGSDPNPKIFSATCGDKSIFITGSVPDIRPYLQSASIIVAPMLSGSGIKNKVLEGMAMAKPVVMTRLANGGIEKAIPGQHYMLADTATEFIEVISNLMQNPHSGLLIGNKARELVQMQYSWQNMQDRCELILREAARMKMTAN